jgi:hypothetical protein
MTGPTLFFIDKHYANFHKIVRLILETGPGSGPDFPIPGFFETTGLKIGREFPTLYSEFPTDQSSQIFSRTRSRFFRNSGL